MAKNGRSREVQPLEHRALKQVWVSRITKLGLNGTCSRIHPVKDLTNETGKVFQPFYRRIQRITGESRMLKLIYKQM